MDTKKETLPEFRTTADVLNWLLQKLQRMTTDYQLMALLEPLTKMERGFLDKAPAHIQIMMRNPDKQVAALEETYKLLQDLMIEKRFDALVGDKRDA